VLQEGKQWKSWIVGRLAPPWMRMLTQGVFSPVQVAIERQVSFHKALPGAADPGQVNLACGNASHSVRQLV
jgi:hypothetical protein